MYEITYTPIYLKTMKRPFKTTVQASSEEEAKRKFANWYPQAFLKEIKELKDAS